MPRKRSPRVVCTTPRGRAGRGMLGGRSGDAGGHLRSGLKETLQKTTRRGHRDTKRRPCSPWTAPRDGGDSGPRGPGSRAAGGGPGASSPARPRPTDL